MVEKDGSSWPMGLSALVLTLALMGSVVWRTQPLRSPRPDSDSGKSEQAVNARMWQDPINALRRGEGKAITASSMDDLREELWQTSVKDPDRVDVLLAMLPSGIYTEDTEARLRARHAVVSAISVAGFRPTDEEHLGALSIDWPNPITKPGQKLPDSLLEPPVESKTKQPEQKAPEQKLPDPIGDAITKVTEVKLSAPGLPEPVGDLTRRPDRDDFTEQTLPFEWFERRLFSQTYSTKAQRVLLIWVPDTMFTDDKVNQRVGLLANALRTSPKEKDYKTDGIVRVSVLGPQGSSLLRQMLPWDNDPKTRPADQSAVAQELAKTKSPKKPLQGVRMYSWSATAMDDLLVHGLDGNPPRSNIAAHLKSCWGLDFKNVIATDDILARELIDELKVRYVDLTDETNHVALIAEWDTFYGRSIPVAFKVALEGFKEGGEFMPMRVVKRVTNYRDTARNEAAGRPVKPFAENVHTYSYLRGIDGKLPGDKAEAKEQPQRSRSTTSEIEQLVRLNDRELNRAEGQNQLDYIPRLGDQLEKLRARLRLEGSDLKAIGVLGSDFYDKVLILQALRDRFPNVLFFTTDLDARLLQPEFLKFTRNLIVASGYGLSLAPSLQNEIPPFRNSYQTANFFAALDALDFDRKNMVRAPAARRFEIGRFNPVDISIGPDDPAHPASHRKAPSLRTVFLTLVMAASAFWLILRVFPLWRAWTMPAGRWGLLEDAVLLGPEEVCSPAEARSGNPADVRRLKAHLWKDARISLDRLKASTQKYTESVLKFLNEELHHYPKKAATVFSEVSAGWIGSPNSRIGEQVQANIAAREQLDESFPKFIKSSRERVARLLSGLKDSVIGARVLLVVAVVFLIWVWSAHIDARGEPFSIWEGTSTWPGEFLRVIAGLFAIYSIGRLMHDLETNRLEICEEMALPLWRKDKHPEKIADEASGQSPESADDKRASWKWLEKCRAYLSGKWFVFKHDLEVEWVIDGVRKSFIAKWLKDFRYFLDWLSHNKIHNWRPQWTAGAYDGGVLWMEYQQRARQALLCWRPVPVVIVYLIFGIALFNIFNSEPFIPARGPLARIADGVFLFGSVLPFLYLTFMVVDAIRLCRVLVIHLIQPTRWPEETEKRFAVPGLGPDWECLDPWIDIQLIARRTAVVSRLVYYPFIILSLLIVARSRYFDAWDWPPALVIILLLNAIWAFSSSLLLRKTAKEAKAATLAALEKRKGVVLSAGDKKGESEQIDRMIASVNSVKDGAFSSIPDDPALRALLLPFTGGGVALLLEFLTSR